MIRKDGNRITIRTGVKVKELSQVQAAELLGLGYRQAKALRTALAGCTSFSLMTCQTSPGFKKSSRLETLNNSSNQLQDDGPRAGLQKRYDEMWHGAERKIRVGDIEIDTLLAEGSPDQRRGLTVIVQPSTNVRRNVNAFLDRLRQIEPDQHYYAPTEFHITVLSLFTATEEHERFFARTAQYQAAVAAALSATAPIQIEFIGITASPAAIMIQGFFDTEALNEARDALREELRRRGLTEGVDGRYRLETAHMTVARFRAPLRDSQRFLAALEESRLLPLGMTRVQSVKLVKNDWYMTHRVLEVVERYALPSTHSGT